MNNLELILLVLFIAIACWILVRSGLLERVLDLILPPDSTVQKAAPPWDSDYLMKKVPLLGVFGVGKTSLVQRFVHGILDPIYLTTIGVKIDGKVFPEIGLRCNTFSGWAEPGISCILTSRYQLTRTHGLKARPLLPTLLPT